MGKKPTRGERVCQFIERYVVVPEGRLIGQPMKLLPFQRKFILDVFDNPAGTKRGILSIARKNGKTGLIAAILLAFIAGPEARLNTQIRSGARSREQAGIVFSLAAKMVQLSPELSKLIRVVPSGKKLIGLARNVEYQALSAEAGSAHGQSPYLLIIDELGQVRGEQDDFIDALITAQGAYDDAMVMVISTQAPTDADMLSIWIDDAIASNDPRTVCHLYEGEKDCDLLDAEAHKAANPALGVFRSQVDLEDEARKAHRMPSAESAFRNLFLNQRVNRNNPFVSPDVWKRAGGDASENVLATCPVWAGLDLSKTTDLTAFVMVAKDEDGIWHAKARFWKPGSTILDHEKRDRAPYTRWQKEGFIEAPHGVSIDYSFVAKQIAADLQGKDVRKVGFDRWKFDQLKPHLEAEDVDPELFVPIAQGGKTFSPFMDFVETELLNERVRHGGNPVLTMCAMNAVAVADNNENRKLDKLKSTGRIDGMVALVMAMGLAASDEGDDGPSVYETRGLLTL